MFSAIAQDHIANPRNSGPLEGDALVGRYGAEGDGPYMTLWLKVQDGHIAQASYQTYGCPSAIACGSMLTQVLKGRPVEVAKAISANDLILLLRGLPEGKDYCAEMAVAAMNDALGQIQGQIEPSCKV